MLRNVDSMAPVCPGLPQSLSTKEELCTLLSVAIFTGTVQHAATNNGQVRGTHTRTPGDPLKVADALTTCRVSSLTGVPGSPTPPAP